MRALAKTMCFHMFSSIEAGSTGTDRYQKGQSRVRTEAKKDKAEYGQSPKRDNAEDRQGPKETTPSA